MISRITMSCGTLAATLFAAPLSYAQMPSTPPARSDARIAPGVVNPNVIPDERGLAQYPEETDAVFARRARQAGATEVQASQIALERTTNPQVKHFAQMMVDDHGKANQTLEALLRQKGWKNPPQLSVNREVEALRDKSGRDFDRAYLAIAGVQAHQEALQLFKSEAAPRANADKELQAFARQTLPALERHLKEAQKLEREKGL